MKWAAKEVRHQEITEKGGNEMRKRGSIIGVIGLVVVALLAFPGAAFAGDGGENNELQTFVSTDGVVPATFGINVVDGTHFSFEDRIRNTRLEVFWDGPEATGWWFWWGNYGWGSFGHSRQTGVQVFGNRLTRVNINCMIPYFASLQAAGLDGAVDRNGGMTQRLNRHADGRSVDFCVGQFTSFASGMPRGPFRLYDPPGKEPPLNGVP